MREDISMHDMDEMEEKSYIKDKEDNLEVVDNDSQGYWRNQSTTSMHFQSSNIVKFQDDGSGKALNYSERFNTSGQADLRSAYFHNGFWDSGQRQMIPSGEMNYQEPDFLDNESNESVATKEQSFMQILFNDMENGEEKLNLRQELTHMHGPETYRYTHPVDFRPRTDMYMSGSFADVPRNSSEAFYLRAQERLHHSLAPPWSQPHIHDVHNMKFGSDVGAESRFAYTDAVGQRAENAYRLPLLPSKYTSHLNHTLPPSTSYEACFNREAQNEKLRDLLSFPQDSRFEVESRAGESSNSKQNNNSLSYLQGNLVANHNAFPIQRYNRGFSCQNRKQCDEMPLRDWQNDGSSLNMHYENGFLPQPNMPTMSIYEKDSLESGSQFDQNSSEKLVNVSQNMYSSQIDQKTELPFFPTIHATSTTNPKANSKLENSSISSAHYTQKVRMFSIEQIQQMQAMPVQRYPMNHQLNSPFIHDRYMPRNSAMQSAQQPHSPLFTMAPAQQQQGQMMQNHPHSSTSLSLYNRQKMQAIAQNSSRELQESHYDCEGSLALHSPGNLSSLNRPDVMPNQAPSPGSLSSLNRSDVMPNQAPSIWRGTNEGSPHHHWLRSNGMSTELHGSSEQNSSLQGKTSEAYMRLSGRVPLDHLVKRFNLPLGSKHTALNQNKLANLPRKRKRISPPPIPWHVVIKKPRGQLLSHQVAQSMWAAASNRLMEKDDAEAETEAINGDYIIEATRRLRLTTQLMQHVIPSLPISLMQDNLLTHYESAMYSLTKVTLEEACKLASNTVKKTTYQSKVQAQAKTMGSEPQEQFSFYGPQYYTLVRFTERSIEKVKKLRLDLIGLEKSSSTFGLCIEIQDIENLSIANRLGRRHGRQFLLDLDHLCVRVREAHHSSPSPSYGVKQVPLQRYCTALPMPRTLPKYGSCLRL